MDGLKDALNHFILDPKNAEILAVVKAARNGAVYGAKVRFPHALVMVFLFRSASFRDKVRLILKATRQHARNLATYATIYKLTMLLLRYLPTLTTSTSDNKPHEGPYDTFIAGLIGGYTVFGRGPQSSVNQQICIYVFARVALSLAKLSVQHPAPSSSSGSPQMKGLIPDIGGRLTRNAWPVFASLSWAFVMYLFRWHPETIQPSLRSSMKYIYTNADQWDSFRNFLVHNS